MELSPKNHVPVSIKFLKSLDYIERISKASLNSLGVILIYEPSAEDKESSQTECIQSFLVEIKVNPKLLEQQIRSRIGLRN